MSGNIQCCILVLQSVISDHVRGIGRNNSKRGGSEYGCCLLDISRYNVDPLFQSVMADAAPCHICALLLDLQSCIMQARIFSFQKDRKNPRSCSEIQCFFVLFHICKCGQKHRIHSKTEPSRTLDDLVSSDLQVIQSFIRK